MCLIKETVLKVLAKYEHIVDMNCVEWQVRNMQTK